MSAETKQRGAVYGDNAVLSESKGVSHRYWRSLPHDMYGVRSVPARRRPLLHAVLPADQQYMIKARALPHRFRTDEHAYPQLKVTLRPMRRRAAASTTPNVYSWWLSSSIHTSRRLLRTVSAVSPQI